MRCGTTRRGRGFRDTVSQTAPFRKPHPTIQANSGMQFPDGVPCIPLRNAKTGWAFRLRSLAETASRNRHSDWDVFPRGPNQPPASRQNHPLSSVVCGTSKECPRVPAIGTSPAAGNISPQLQKPVQATVVTCTGLVGAHKGTLQRPTSVMDYRTAPARDASVGLPNNETRHSPRQSAQCRQSADTAK